MDTEIDKRLEAIEFSDEALAGGQAGSPTPSLRAYEEVFVGGKRETPLAEAGAWVRRGPLWASTGREEPDYSDTLYVTGCGANTVNTMPEKTIDAVADHGDIRATPSTGHYWREA